MIDVAPVVAALFGMLFLAIAYRVRCALWGRVRSPRLAKEGGGLISMFVLEGAYWGLGFATRACVALNIGPNGVTTGSLVLGTASGVALALGHFGIAGVLAAVAALADSLDGLVARAMGTSSASGEVFDAAVDRYTEFFFIGAMCVAFRDDVRLLLLVLATLLGSFMISYSTAKAEAMGVEPPRGLMRRGERAVFLILGTSLTPLAQAMAPADASPFVGLSPILVALGLVGVISNVSAITRFAAIARSVRAAAPGSPS
jgi:CDP-diacylglycerol---glycerol-3-phosphate 3-phosphatidyltransferase